MDRTAAAAKGDGEGGNGEAAGPGGVTDQVFNGGEIAAKLVGRSAILAVLEKVPRNVRRPLGQDAERSVIKRTLKALQPAVESLNDNQNLLPAMFPSSRRMHIPLLARTQVAGSVAGTRL